VDLQNCQKYQKEAGGRKAETLIKELVPNLTSVTAEDEAMNQYGVGSLLERHE
jgi:hypothetical protein